MKEEEEAEEDNPSFIMWRRGCTEAVTSLAHSVSRASQGKRLSALAPTDSMLREHMGSPVLAALLGLEDRESVLDTASVSPATRWKRESASSAAGACSPIQTRGA
ncbi:hypothetical protein H920_07798 [Fukomys damarensis]|uniref:Uncharacterized protein n=1 Tax=Fukomys damarensis TaxID=885580 RepID=A0A091E6S0_FUKDA|nr:hypothetical protein H920_07798 [Fukomys damarensis]